MYQDYKIKQKSIQSMSQNETNQETPLEYFLKLQQQLPNLRNYEFKSKQLNQNIIQKVQHDIIESRVRMPKQLGMHKLDVSPPKKKQAEKINEQDMLKSVQLQKKKVIQKMKSLEKQELQLKLNIRTKQDKSRMIYRSQMTEKDKQKLKQLIISSRKFEDAVKKKSKELQQMQLQKSLEQLKNYEDLLQSKRQQRRSLVVESLKSMQLRSQQKRRINQQRNQKLQSIMRKKYLYEQLQQKQRQQQQQKWDNYQQVLEEIKDRYRLDFKQIQEHQKKYNKALKDYRQKSHSKIIENSSHINKSYGKNYYRSLTKKMIHKQKLQQYQRYKQAQKAKQKMLKFQEQVNKKFKPKISEKSRFKVQKHHSSVRALSLAEQNMKGAQYLDIAKKLKDLQKQKQKRKTHAVPISKPQYKNYIQDLNLPQYDTAQKKFKQAVKSGRTMSDYDSAIKAVQLAQLIEAKSKTTKDQKLVNSVKHKLQILQALD